MIYDTLVDESWVYLTNKYGYMSSDNEDDIDFLSDKQNEYINEHWSYVEDRFRNMSIVEDDGIWCMTCKGTGEIDWVTNVMSGGK